MSIRPKLALICAALMSVCSLSHGSAVGAGASTSLPADVSALPPAKAELMPVDQVKAGMRVVAYTVFEGNKIEPFTGVVQGIAWNYFGPQRHIIVVRFEGERLEHVGIVHGMSGSPVYIDGKLVGALSLALSPFPKDPIGGVTPIAYMLDEGQDHGVGPGTPGPSSLLPTRVGWATPGATAPTEAVVEGRAGQEDGQTAQAGTGTGSNARSMSAPAAAGQSSDGAQASPARSAEPGSRRSAGLGGTDVTDGSSAGGASTGSLEGRMPQSVPPFRPLLAPLTFTGVDAAVFDHYRSAFSGLPVDVQLGGAGSGNARSSTPAEVAEAAASLQPGAPVAGVLVEGDVSLSATGTITYRDGDRIYAFGHPFLQQGEVSIPMASSEIVATVADQTYPYKLANQGTLVGTVTHDRVTAIVGKIGEVPQMMPLRLSIQRQGEPSTVFSYRLVEHKELTPVLLQLILANSLKKQWRYADEATYFVKARIKVRDGQEIVTRGAYSVAATPGGGAGSIYDVIKNIAEPFGALYQNPFRPVQLQGVDIDIDLTDPGRLYEVADVYVDRTGVRPGEKVELRVAVQKLRGERQVRTISVPVPPGLSGGQIVLKVADADTMEKTGVVGGRLAPRQAQDFDQLVSILNRTRSGDRCYVQLLRRSPGVVLQHEQMTTLPRSVKNVLQKTASAEVPGGLDRTVLWEGELPFDGALIGSQELPLQVLPPL